MEDSRFKHLRLDGVVEPGKALTERGLEGRYRYFIRKGLVSSRFFMRLLGFADRQVNALKVTRDAIAVQQHSLDNLAKDCPDAQLLGSSYGYDDELTEIAVAVTYQKEVEHGLENSSGESAKLYEHAVSTLSGILSKDPSVKSVVNFGVSYAYVDSLLARKYPHVNFVGIDRSHFTRCLNEACFCHLSNMRFVAADIFDYLSTKTFEDGVFFHCRTLTVLPPRFIEKLYLAAKSAGFKYIVGMEPMGISRQTGEPYEFSFEQRPSVVYRGIMCIHNYPEILRKAEYEVQSIELLKTGHEQSDYRILSFVAQ